jgi:hypothetical protein
MVDPDFIDPQLLGYTHMDINTKVNFAAILLSEGKEALEKKVDEDLFIRSANAVLSQKTKNSRK